MAGLTSLPDETLKQILDLALLGLTPRGKDRFFGGVPESPHHLLFCMLLLCRRTHMIALGMLYRHVRLDDSGSAKRFLECACNWPALAGLMQILELRLSEFCTNNEEKSEKEHKEGAETLRRLSSLLRIAPNLETLYLTAEQVDLHLNRAHFETKFEPHLIESLASQRALRVLKLRNWTIDVADVPLLVGAITNKPHLAHFGFIHSQGMDSWTGKTLLRDSWRMLERDDPNSPLMETGQQCFPLRAYMYSDIPELDCGFLELVRYFRKPRLLHLAVGVDFTPETMQTLKKALEPCEVEVLHLRLHVADDRRAPEERDDQILIDILNSQPSLKQLGVPYPALESPEKVFAALPSSLEVLEVERLHRDSAEAPYHGNTLQGLQLMSSLITQGATPWSKLRTLRLPKLIDAACPVLAFDRVWTSCGVEKACEEAGIELGEADALLDYF